MTLPETPEIPWELPQGKPHYDFASKQVAWILDSVIAQTAPSLRDEALEIGLMEEMNNCLSSSRDEEPRMIALIERISDYADELFLGGDFKGADQVLLIFMQRLKIQMDKEKAEKGVTSQKDA